MIKRINVQLGIISVVRRKTIYEYHRINKMKTDIKSGVAIWFRAQKTCNVQKSCDQCVKQSKVIYMKRNRYLEMVLNIIICIFQEIWKLVLLMFVVLVQLVPKIGSVQWRNGPIETRVANGSLRWKECEDSTTVQGH